MNIACKNFKDIRFFHEDGMKVYRRAVLSKRDVVTADDYVYLRQTTLPIANKIIAIIDLEVLSQSVWKKIKAGDFDGLAKVFNEDDIIFDNIHVEYENKEKVEEPKKVNEEVVDTTRTEAVEALVDAIADIEVSNESDEVKEAFKENLKDNLTETTISNEEKEDDPEVAIDEVKELEDITQNTETVENSNHQNNNNSFKKKRRH